MSSSKEGDVGKYDQNEVFEVQGPKLPFNPDPRGCGAHFFDKLAEHGEKICQVCSVTGQTETFSSVKLRSTRVAMEMRRLGIQPQDVVILCNYNTLDSVVPLLATQFIGAVTASLDPSLSVKDMAHLVGLVKPKMAFVCQDSINDVKEALQQAGLELTLVVFGKSPNCLEFDQFLAAKPEEKRFQPLVVNETETAFIMFSSGTTGFPKGLTLTHYGLLYAAMSLLGVMLDCSTLTHFSTFYWISAVNITFINIMMGARRVLIPKPDVNTFFKVVQDYKVTYCFLSSTISYKLTENVILPYDTSSFRELVFGGDSTGNQIDRLRKLLPHTRISLGYGQTEVGGFITGLNAASDVRAYESRLVSSGPIAPGVAARIVDPKSEKILGPHEKGEIRINCKSHFKNYFNADTQGAFDSDGWLRTGDIGYFDGDSFLYVVDRIKEMFKFQCWHIVPASLEAVLYEHPAVLEAVVMGIPHEADGCHPMAVVVLKKEALEVNGEDLVKFVEERVVDRQRLRAGVRIVKNIVKTPTGKPLRRIMREKIIRGEFW